VKKGEIEKGPRKWGKKKTHDRRKKTPGSVGNGQRVDVAAIEGGKKKAVHKFNAGQKKKRF